MITSLPKEVMHNEHGTHLDDLVPAARDDDRVHDVRAEANAGHPTR